MREFNNNYFLAIGYFTLCIIVTTPFWIAQATQYVCRRGKTLILGF